MVGRPTIDQLAARYQRDVPRFVAALEANRYLILDRDRLRPAPPPATNAQRVPEPEPTPEPAPEPPVSEPAAEPALRRLRRALRAHHMRSFPGQICQICRFTVGELSEFSDR